MKKTRQLKTPVFIEDFSRAKLKKYAENQNSLHSNKTQE